MFKVMGGVEASAMFKVMTGVVVVVNHCFTSLFGTKGILSDIDLGFAVQFNPFVTSLRRSL